MSYRLLVTAVAVGLMVPLTALAQSKSDYCYTSPAISSSVEPNIMLMLDSSGSMDREAYDPHWAYDNCIENGNWCSFADSNGNYDSSRTYFGYAKPDHWYEWKGSGFEPVSDCTSCGSTIPWRDGNGNFSGNVINFVYMDRIDVGRQALMGGKTSPRISNGPNSINQYIFEDGESIDPVAGVPDQENPSGVIQDFADDARLGLATFAGSGGNVDGAEVNVDITNTNLTNTFTAIENWSPSGNTPLAEALWSLNGYFAQEGDAGDMPDNISGDGPRYKGGDYSINDNSDPWNYGSGGNTKFASCADSFVLYVTDGAPTADDKLPPEFQDYDQSPDTGNAFDSGFDHNNEMENIAFYGRTNDLRPNDIDAKQNLILYNLYAFGSSSNARDLLQKAAATGGFEDNDGDGVPYYSSGCTIGSSNSDPKCKEWDEDLDGVPNTYFEAQDGSQLESQIRQALNAILQRASTGSTVATISTQTRSGGNLLQAYYLPLQTRTGSAGTANVAWQGFLRGLWTDPGGNVREDNPDNDQLELTQDDIAQFQFDSSNQQVVANLFPDDGSISGSEAGDSVPDTCDVSSPEVETIPSVEASGLWEAGQKLAERDPDDRDIWFNPDDSSVADADGLAEFTTANASTIRPYWEASSSKTKDLIKFIRGYDNPNGNTSFRQRQGEDWTTADYWGSGGGQHPWKLGSIITSTPKVLRVGAVSSYTDSQGTYRSYTRSSTVQDRPSMVFVGANDGMLHAFYTGDVEANTSDPNVAADLEDEAASKEAGKEAWAFMPESALPYLRWYAGLDETCHIPTVDYRTQLIDVATGGSWKTLLIGTMGFGGRSIECGDVDGDGSSDIKSSSIFVLDVTDPEDPELVFEQSFADDSLTLTFPAVVHKDGNLTGGSWYLVAGSGPLNVAGSGPNDPDSSSFSSNPSLFVYDLADGSLERRMDLTDGSSFADSNQALSGNPGVALGELVPMDPDRDDITDSVYVGTYSDPGGGTGKLYRLQLTGSSPSQWALREAAVVPSNAESSNIEGRPFFAAPSAAFDEFDNFWIYAGTGRFMDEADTAQNEDPQFFFGYIEDCWGDGVNDDNAEGGTNCSSVAPVEVQNDLLRTRGVTVEGTGSDLECRCGSIQFDAPDFDSSTDSFSCPRGSEEVITDVEGVSYDCSNVDGLTCNSAKDLREKVEAAGGWYWDLTGGERIFSQPFVRGGLVNILSFTPNTDLCGFGGDTATVAVDFRTGAPPPAPVFLNSAGFTGDMDSSGEIRAQIDLGKGVPPMGQGFAAMPSTGEGEAGALTQTSTGEINRTQKQTNKLKSGVLFMRSP